MLGTIGKVEDILVWIVVVMGVVKKSGVVSFGIVTSFVVGLLVVVSTILVGVELQLFLQMCWVLYWSKKILIATR